MLVTCLYNNNQETKLQCFLVALTWMSQLAWLVLGARCVAKAHFIIIWQKCQKMFYKPSRFIIRLFSTNSEMAMLS